MRRNEVPWSRIKRKTVTSEPIYARYKPKRWIKLLAGIIAFAILVWTPTVLRIPERVGLITYPEEEKVETTLRLTNKYSNLVEELFAFDRELDWDGDGLDNGADPYPWDIDHDRNGIPDGMPGVNFIDGALPIRYGNIEAVASSTKSGFLCWNGRYYFQSLAGWVAIDDVEGVPYLRQDGKWQKAEFEYTDEKCYVNIPGDCELLFSEYGLPKDREVILPIEAAECTKHPDERYTVANAPLSLLAEIYAKIDNGLTAQVSILTDDGEQLLIVYGYDEWGNLLVADLDSMSENRKIQIHIRAQFFYSHDQVTMREWFDFDWGDLSSANGEVLILF